MNICRNNGARDSSGRYSRTVLLENMSEEKQNLLLYSSVLIIGCGALGSIASMYLAGSGIGRIGIVDFDTIGISNLQRQLSFTESDTGKKKTDVLAGKLRQINSEIRIEPYDCFLQKKQAFDLISDYDFVLEGSDNPATKYMIADICAELGKPCCIGGIAQYNGQVLTQTPTSLSYRDVFPEPAADGEYLPCSSGGVFGPLPGIIASIQACEVIKYLCNVGELLTNRILLVDALNMSVRTLEINGD